MYTKELQRWISLSSTFKHLLPPGSVRTSTGCAHSRKASDRRVSRFLGVAAVGAIVAVVGSDSYRQQRPWPQRSPRRCFGSNCGSFDHTSLVVEANQRWNAGWCYNRDVLCGRLPRTHHRHRNETSLSLDRRKSSMSVAVAVEKTGFLWTPRDPIVRPNQRTNGCLNLNNNYSD